MGGGVANPVKKGHQVSIKENNTLKKGGFSESLNKNMIFIFSIQYVSNTCKT